MWHQLQYAVNFIVLERVFVGDYNSKKLSRLIRDDLLFFVPPWQRSDFIPLKINQVRKSYMEVTWLNSCISDTRHWHWSADTLFGKCQLPITWMSIRMSTVKLNTACICLGHLASNARKLQEDSQSERAYYCSHIINLLFTMLGMTCATCGLNSGIQSMGTAFHSTVEELEMVKHLNCWRHQFPAIITVSNISSLHTPYLTA